MHAHALATLTTPRPRAARTRTPRLGIMCAHPGRPWLARRCRSLGSSLSPAAAPGPVQPPAAAPGTRPAHTPRTAPARAACVRQLPGSPPSAKAHSRCAAPTRPATRTRCTQCCTHPARAHLHVLDDARERLRVGTSAQHLRACMLAAPKAAHGVRIRGGKLPRARPSSRPARVHVGRRRTGACSSSIGGCPGQQHTERFGLRPRTHLSAAARVCTHVATARRAAAAFSTQPRSSHSSAKWDANARATTSGRPAVRPCAWPFMHTRQVMAVRGSLARWLRPFQQATHVRGTARPNMHSVQPHPGPQCCLSQLTGVDECALARHQQACCVAVRVHVGRRLQARAQAEQRQRVVACGSGAEEGPGLIWLGDGHGEGQRQRHGASRGAGRGAGGHGEREEWSGG